MRSLLTLTFALALPFVAQGQIFALETAALQELQDDPCDGYCDGVCVDGECYMSIPPSQLALAQTGTCPEDPCGGLCLAGICYEIRPVIEHHEPLTQSPDAAMIQWEGCPDVPCGGICLAGICSEIRPLSTETVAVER